MTHADCAETQLTRRASAGSPPARCKLPHPAGGTRGCGTLAVFVRSSNPELDLTARFRGDVADFVPWRGGTVHIPFPMQLFLAALAVLFVILGFAGFGLGGLPTILFWVLAAFCLVGAWKLRSDRQRRREDRAMGGRAH